MRKIRVLVVDDSVVIRRLLTDILTQDPEIEIVGTAPNGKIALAKLPQVNPDLVTLDIEMPEMNGLETITALRKDYPKLPVIMFSTLTERGAQATLHALASGASDYVTKPANVGSMAAGMQNVREQLLPKIKAFCANIGAPPPASRSRSVARPPSSNSKRIELVVIGASTGGPQALTAVLRALPASFPVPIVVVQHMPPVFTQHFAARLNQECALRVSEARDNDHLVPGEVLIAPGNFHVQVVRRGVELQVQLQQEPPENSCRPAVDVLFRSAAQTLGPYSLGVVLTGMGQDGLRGAQELVRAGSTVFAQDQETSIVWGMPRGVTEAGLAAQVLPLSQISGAIQNQAQYGRISRTLEGAKQ